MKPLYDHLGFLPAFIKDLAVTVWSSRLQSLRRSGAYSDWLSQYRAWRKLSRSELIAVQTERRNELVQYASANSSYYRAKYNGCDLADFEALPTLQKSEVREHIGELVIGDPKTLLASFTGGTTGAGLTVYNAASSFQERFALLDLFWELHGFKIGSARIAWFSGRQLIWDADVRRGIFWRTNWRNQIRYYSTFHMNASTFQVYLNNLNQYNPEYITGFPSAISEIARFVEQSGKALKVNPKAVFCTSETLDNEQRNVIERVFGCKVRNQYSASEGAPFIVECPLGTLHLDITTGVLEVVDEWNRQCTEGEILVTPFFTRNTPLIRYRIGDVVKMGSGNCDCGWRTPIVEAINGRLSDYIEVPGRGKLFNSQIGDCVKGVTSVIRFQVEMVEGRLQVYMMADRTAFEKGDRDIFIHKLRERIGNVMVDVHYVEDLPRAVSGKHSIIRKRTATSLT